MNNDEALAWLRGERSMANLIELGGEGFAVKEIRVMQADAAMIQQAFWVAKWHQEQYESLMKSGGPPPPDDLPAPKKKHPPSEVVVQLADHLFTKIHDRNPSFTPLGRSAWASDIDKMIRLDGRDPDDIGRVIDWCQADEFWQNNILSGAKLRKQFDQLSEDAAG